VHICCVFGHGNSYAANVVGQSVYVRKTEKMFTHRIDGQTELRPVEHRHADDLFKLIKINREHLRRWLPYVDLMCSPADVGKSITAWQQMSANNRGIYAGIWFDGRLCGIIHHLNVDWLNRCAVLSYWLDAAHQGRGIMTACCRAFVAHGFDTWNLNRITIECATGNTRSRAIPERLGFTFEGIVRGIEWLHDHFADHAIYGMLRSEHVKKRGADSAASAGADKVSAATAGVPSFSNA
jgi:ribosomal-protein-serine acetyltransferase